MDVFFGAFQIPINLEYELHCWVAWMCAEAFSNINQQSCAKV